jgi:hypothetical protein
MTDTADLAVSGSPPLTCGTCKHWHKKINPHNIRDARGDCRFNPPCVTTLPQGANTFCLSSYPSLPDSFPACSKHEAKVAIEG